MNYFVNRAWTAQQASTAFSALALSALLPGCASAPAATPPAELARQWFESAYSQKDTSLADTLFSPTATFNGVAGGPETPKANVAGYLAAFPDMTATIDRQVESGPNVVTFWTARGTHSGSFLGIEPTGRQIETSIVVFWRVEDGKVVEDLTVYDRLSVLQQLKSPVP